MVSVSLTDDIAKALLSLSSHPVDIHSQCHYIHAHIKKVTRKTAERGDVVVALLSIQQIKKLSDNFHMVIAQLLSQDGSTQKEELLTRLIATLSTSLYPVARCIVQKGVLCLWLQRGPISCSVLLQALAVSNMELTGDKNQTLMSVKQALNSTERCYQALQKDQKEVTASREQDEDSVEPTPLLAHSVLKSLYGANTLLAGQCVECCLPGDSDKSWDLNSTLPLNSDLTAYRGTLIARQLAALVIMCGGTILAPSCGESPDVVCNASGEQKLTCDHPFGDDRTCCDSEAEHDCSTGVSAACRSTLSDVAPAAALLRLLVSWSPCIEASADGITVGPVVAANNKKKLRVEEDWDLDRCWK